jgi:hypothetical protein
MIGLVVSDGQVGADVLHGYKRGLRDADVVFVSGSEEDRLLDDVVLLRRNYLCRKRPGSGGRVAERYARLSS